MESARNNLMFLTKLFDCRSTFCKLLQYIGDLFRRLTTTTNFFSLLIHKIILNQQNYQQWFILSRCSSPEGYYTTDGMLNIDNNPVENSIRPLALGRKNYLFAGSHEAARRSGMLYSLLGTCKMHGIEPYSWLKEVLQRIADHPINKIQDLLPHRYKM